MYNHQFATTWTKWPAPFNPEFRSLLGHIFFFKYIERQVKILVMSVLKCKNIKNIRLQSFGPSGQFRLTRI